MPSPNPIETTTPSTKQSNSARTADIDLIKQNDTPDATQFDFLSLPPEIREIVYEHAFGTNPRFFCVKNLKDIAVTATLGAPPFLDTFSAQWLRPHDPCNRGLPFWITTCKQLCTEGLDVFLRIRTFSPLVLGYDRHYRSASAKENSLVFTGHTIRSIAIPQNYTVTYANPAIYGFDEGLIRAVGVWRRTRPGLQAFLDYIRQRQLQDLTLELRWDRHWHGNGGSKCETWLHCEERAFDFLDSTWDGTVKRLKLTIVYHSKTGDGVERLVEMAEICARRLIGTEKGCSLSWGDEVEGTKYFSVVRLDVIEVAESKKWERTLLACRR